MLRSCFNYGGSSLLRMRAHSTHSASREEVDALVERSLLWEEERQEPELHNSFTFAHPEMKLVSRTGDGRSAMPLD